MSIPLKEILDVRIEKELTATGYHLRYWAKTHYGEERISRTNYENWKYRSY